MPISVRLLPFSVGSPEGEADSRRSRSIHEHREKVAILLSEDLWLGALECFLETAGLTAALPILRPIAEGFGKLGIQRRLNGDQASKLEEIISCECLLTEIMLGGSSRGEIFENGARIHKSGCKLGGRCPEICFLCCQMMGEACTKAMNPNYDHLLVESISCGDSECGWILRKGGETCSDLGERIQFETFPPKGETEAIRVSLQEKYVESWRILTKAFIRSVGEEKAARALEKSIRSLGTAKGEEYAKALKIKDSEIDSVGSLVGRVFDLLGMADEAVDEERLRGDNIVVHSWPSMIGLQIEALCIGVLEGINPDYESAYDNAIGMGDQMYEWLMRKKAMEPAPNEGIP